MKANFASVCDVFGILAIQIFSAIPFVKRSRPSGWLGSWSDHGIKGFPLFLHRSFFPCWKGYHFTLDICCPSNEMEHFLNKFLLVSLAILFTNQSSAGVDVYFSPHGGCTEVVCKCLDRATNSVRVQAYSLTGKEIAAALVSAKKRGVDVQVILDRSQATQSYSEADFLARSGIATVIDRKHAIAHNKVMIIDAVTVITGSFNFTRQAERENAENLLILTDQSIAFRYGTNWIAHKAHSDSYTRRPL